jgi:hypothetical protein
MLKYLKEHIKAEPIAVIALIITGLYYVVNIVFNWYVFKSSSSTELEFVCNDASNSNGYVAKDGAYLLIEVLCKIRNLGSRNISIDSYEGLYYYQWDKEPHPSKSHSYGFSEDKINASVLKRSDYFKVPFPLAPGDQRNVNLLIQVPIGFKDRNKGLSECSPNESLTELAVLNHCFDHKIQRTIPNYLYEGIDSGLLNDIGLRVYTSDKKSYDSKIPLDYLGYRPNERISKLSDPLSKPLK